MKRIVAMVVIVSLLPACMKTVRIPEEEFSALRPAKHTYVDVTTRDAAYRVTEFTLTDSTLIIEKMAPASKAYPARDDATGALPYLPYPVPLASIESITRTHGLPNTVVVVGSICGVLSLFAVIISTLGPKSVY